MIIPRYVNIGENCGSAKHGTIRRYQSWGLLTPTSYYYIRVKRHKPYMSLFIGRYETSRPTPI